MRVNVTFEIPESTAARARGLLLCVRTRLRLRRPCAPIRSNVRIQIWMKDSAFQEHIASLRTRRSLNTSASRAPVLRALAMAAARRPVHAPDQARRPGHTLHDVAHGSLRVPHDADHLFNEAVHYLERDSSMRAVIAKVEHSRTEVTLRIVHNGADRYEPDNRTVVWDPLSALRTTAGGRQSPALGLGHELAHAAAASSLLDRGMRARLRGYDNAEERRVVRGAEAHAARTLGEAARSDHRGTCYEVASPVICRLAA